MSNECYETEDLGDLIAAIRRGAQPEHLRTCPRCRALLASYRAFLDPPDLPQGSKIEEVAQRAGVATITGLAAGTARDAGPQRTQPHRPRSLLGFAWFRAAAAAAVIVLVVFIAREVRQDALHERPSHILRGGALEETATLQLLAARGTENGGAILAWGAVANADAYIVVFYRPDLTEQGRREIVGDTTLVLRPDELLALRAQRPLYWRVVAQRSRGELLRSAPRELVLPEAPTR